MSAQSFVWNYIRCFVVMEEKVQVDAFKSCSRQATSGFPMLYNGGEKKELCVMGVYFNH